MSRQRRSAVSRVAMVLACLALAALASARLELHFVDVGHGDALLIRTPDGHAIVYDGGPSETALLDYLQRIGIETVDVVIASHAADTHITGLPAVIEAFAPATFLDNGLPETGAAYERLMAAVAASHAEALGPGPRQIDLGDVTLHVLPVPGTAWGQADNSLGLVVEYGHFRASLLGNAGPALQTWLLDQIPDGLTPVQVHKASAHGSTSGDTADMLARLQPEVVVVSVGAEAVDGADPAVLALYGAEGATRISRTDTDGTVTIVAWSDGTYNLRPSRRTTPTASTRAGSHLSTVGLPFNASDVQTGWVRTGDIVAPEVRLVVRSSTSASLERLWLTAEFFLTDPQDGTRRLGGATRRVVDVDYGDVPIPPATDQAVRLRLDGGVVGSTPPAQRTRVDVYYRLASGEDWVRLDSFDVDPVLR